VTSLFRSSLNTTGATITARQLQLIVALRFCDAFILRSYVIAMEVETEAPTQASQVSQLALSTNLRHKLTSIEEIATQSSRTILHEYTAAKAIFAREYPGRHDFDSLLTDHAQRAVAAAQKGFLRTGPKRRQLLESSWALTDESIVNEFGCETLRSEEFLTHLVAFSKTTERDEAFKAIRDARDKRVLRLVPRSGVSRSKDWMPCDVIAAMSQFSGIDYRPRQKAKRRSKKRKRRDNEEDDRDSPPRHLPSPSPSRSQSQESDIESMPSPEIARGHVDAEEPFPAPSDDGYAFGLDFPEGSVVEDGELELDTTQEPFGAPAPCYLTLMQTLNDAGGTLQTQHTGHGLDKSPPALAIVAQDGNKATSEGGIVQDVEKDSTTITSSSALLNSSHSEVLMKPSISKQTPQTSAQIDLTVIKSPCPDLRLPRRLASRVNELADLSVSAPGQTQLTTSGKLAGALRTSTTISTPATNLPLPRRRALSVHGVAHPFMSASTQTQLIPTNDLSGALGTFSTVRWLSCTAIELVLDIFARPPFRVLDSKCLDLQQPNSVYRRRPPPLQPDETTTIRANSYTVSPTSSLCYMIAISLLLLWIL